MLNSFWVKFGQRENLPQVKQCTTPQELYNIAEDDTNEVQDPEVLGAHVPVKGDSHVLIVKRLRDGRKETSVQANVQRQGRHHPGECV